MDVHAIDVGLTPQAHDHHKRVGLEIDLRGHLHHHAVNDEVWAVDELRYGLRAVVAAAILGPHLVVDGVARLLDMQLARLAMRVLASEIVHAVSDVGCFLNLSQEVAGANGVQSSRRQEIQVAVVRLVGGDDRSHWVLAILLIVGAHQPLIVVGRDAFPEAAINFRPHITLDDIPHLRLSGAAVALHGQFVVGMHLHGKVLSRVDEFHEQRKLIAEMLVNLVAHEQSFVFVDELGECEAHVDVVHQSAVDGHALVSGHAAYFPALADIGLRREYSLERRNLIATP